MEIANLLADIFANNSSNFENFNPNFLQIKTNVEESRSYEVNNLQKIVILSTRKLRSAN